MACFILALSVVCFTLAQAQSCYDSDGTKVTHGIIEGSGKRWMVCPRSSDGSSVQTCCLDGGDSCFSQGMCYSAAGGSFYRGMCTDPSWKDSTCPQMCKGRKCSRFHAATAQSSVQLMKTIGDSTPMAAQSVFANMEWMFKRKFNDAHNAMARMHNICVR